MESAEYDVSNNDENSNTDIIKRVNEIDDLAYGDLILVKIATQSTSKCNRYKIFLGKLIDKRNRMVKFLRQDVF